MMGTGGGGEEGPRFSPLSQLWDAWIGRSGGGGGGVTTVMRGIAVPPLLLLLLGQEADLSVRHSTQVRWKKKVEEGGVCCWITEVPQTPTQHQPEPKNGFTCSALLLLLPFFFLSLSLSAVPPPLLSGGRVAVVAAAAAVPPSPANQLCCLTAALGRTAGEKRRLLESGRVGPFSFLCATLSN